MPEPALLEVTTKPPAPPEPPEEYGDELPEDPRGWKFEPFFPPCLCAITCAD